jgi:hypothetical protein
MSYYKTPDNFLHYLSDEDIANGGEKLLPLGCVSLTDEQYQAIAAEQNKPTAQQIEAQFTAFIQQRLDDFARTRNYDSILSACTYATSTVAKFKTEGQACVNLRDATWAAAYTILANVQAGKRPMPTSIADIEADLPAAVWPA